MKMAQGGLLERVQLMRRVLFVDDHASREPSTYGLCIKRSGVPSPVSEAELTGAALERLLE